MSGGLVSNISFTSFSSYDVFEHGGHVDDGVLVLEASKQVVIWPRARKFDRLQRFLLPHECKLHSRDQEFGLDHVELHDLHIEA